MFRSDSAPETESCDFFVGTGHNVTWLGSAALPAPDAAIGDLPARRRGEPVDADYWRLAVSMVLHHHYGVGPDNGRPGVGWPWPWASPSETDNAYTFSGGVGWVSRRGGPWRPLWGPLEAELDPSPVLPDIAGQYPPVWTAEGLDATERYLFETPLDQTTALLSAQREATGVPAGVEFATQAALFARRRRAGLHTRLVSHSCGAVLRTADDICYLWVSGDASDGTWVPIPPLLPADLRYEGATFDVTYRQGELAGGLFRRQGVDDEDYTGGEPDGEHWSWFDPSRIDLAALQADLAAAGFTVEASPSPHSVIVRRSEPARECCARDTVITAALPTDWELPGAPRRAVECVRMLEEATSRPWPAYGPLSEREALLAARP